MKTKEEKKWPKLPIPFKIQWTNALRSGEYVQGKGALAMELDSKDGCKGGAEFCHCCLGVAAVISGAESRDIRGSAFISEKIDGVPEQLIGGEGDPDEDIETNRLTLLLANMNDGAGDQSRKYTFSEIADWIDANI